MNNNDALKNILNESLVTFITESRDLLQVMEQELLECEHHGVQSDSIATLFRAAHTIKGSAGLFGFDALVAFAHEMESLLHHVREGIIPLNRQRIEVLLAATDHLTTLVNLAATGVEIPADVVAHGAALRNRITEAATTTLTTLATAPPPSLTTATLIPEADTRTELGDYWHISIRFSRDVLRNGTDPLGILRYLQRLGRITNIATVTTELPRAANMDPEDCYLGFEIKLESTATKVELEAAFAFVRDNCRLRIIPSQARLAEYLANLDEMDETERLGQILIRCGALTSWGLQEALRLQVAMTAELPDGLVATHKPLGQVVVEAGIVPPEIVQAALNTQQRARERRATESSLLRVNAAKLDALIEIIGELVIASAGADLLARQTGFAELQEASAAVARLVEGVRNGALQLRMVQIGDTFRRFQRVVRDVSKEIGKEIELVINGAETELDKTVVEQIGDPLTHLVRNAIDHGIESPEIRVANGKPAHGCLTLNAYHDAGAIVIAVMDDGAGLNLTRIRQLGEQRGLISPGQVISDEELARIIFEPGFSTANTVTNLSGRGVGMDVVKRNIEALRGEVNIETRAGKGTTISLRLPLTLAIIDGFLVGVGEAQYVVPLNMVAECREFTPRDAELAEIRNCLNLRGVALPCIHLHDYFGRREPIARRRNVVVVRAGQRQAGLIVDRLMGQFQTVIKPLSPIFGTIPGVSGTTILGSGKVALILDIPGLIQHAAEREYHLQKLPRKTPALAGG